MDILTEQEQIKILECGYTTKERWNRPSSNYYKAVYARNVYPKCDELYKKWSYFHLYSDKNKDQLINEEYTILREVDEEAFHTLYRRLFNPVSLNYYAEMQNNQLIYSFVVHVDSIDDSAYRFYFNNKSRLEMESLRSLMVEYIEEHPIIYISKLKDFCLGLGATDESY